jgi:hypothetical protein
MFRHCDDRINLLRFAAHVHFHGFSGHARLKSMSYKTQAIAARMIAPITRIWTAPPPLAYLSSVREPWALSHPGRRNQARGEASIKAELIVISSPTSMAMDQPRIRVINIRPFFYQHCFDPLERSFRIVYEQALTRSLQAFPLYRIAKPVNLSLLFRLCFSGA